MKTASDNIGLPGYDLIGQLHCSSKAMVYRAIPQDGNHRSTVVIKFMAAELPSDRELLQFRHQYQIAKNLNLSGIIHPLRLVEHRRGYALVMEDFGGISLPQYRSGQPLECGEVISIAIQLADILQAIHQQGIIHKDIKPANILIHPVTKQVKLIDFGLSSLLPSETPEIANPNVLEGTLAYISPEQTGRMNRGIDYRTDFYGLGVTFYQLLTGRLPFVSEDAMELVHCHLAQIAKPVAEVQPAVPSVLSQIVAKLMAKNVEDRYQSALGLKSDLENCSIQWKKNGSVSDFQLGVRDLSDRFLIPDKLYGRAVEVQTLLESFDRVAQGSTEMLLIAGFSGIGKTAVVNEIHKPIVRQRGYFIKGKFDQFNRNIPLSAFVQALRDLMGQLLAESDLQLAQWQSQILSAVGEHGQVLIEVIPELAQIIGKQPPAPELSGSAAQNRFNLLFQKFIQVFTTATHPLVIFVDDLQWADLASIELMKPLMNGNGYLSILGAYRDNEVSSTHPLMLLVAELQQAQIVVNTMQLTSLALTDTNQLVADTLNCPPALAQPLTELIDRKTTGNPFFTTQFLKSLHEDGYITFNPDRRYWECDIAQVQNLTLTDDVVEFMAQQLQKLPSTTQIILQLAACIGNQFDLTTLAIVSEQSTTATAAALWQALQEGLILPTSQVYKFFQETQPSHHDSLTANPTYRFLHDRVQQAAYSLIPEQNKQATHQQIGQRLLDNTNPEKQEEYLFTIVNHLNRGILILSPQGQEQLAWLNLKAGRKAKLSNAYQAAVAYFEQGIQLLPRDSWDTLYPLTLALHQDITESSYLNSDFEQVEKWSNMTCQFAKSSLDTIKVQQNRILATNVQGKIMEALDIGLKVLRSLGLEFPEQPTQTDLEQAFGATRMLWADRPIANLFDLPPLTDRHLLAQMEVLSALSSTAYIVNPHLMSLLVFKQVEISISCGNCPVSVFTYSDYGVILCGIIGDIESGYEFGELAIRLRERWQMSSAKSRNLFVVNFFVKHWKSSLAQIVPTIEAAYHSGIETGDIESANLNAQLYCNYAFYQGQSLTTLLPKLVAYRQIIMQHQHLHCLMLQNVVEQLVLNLLGHNQHPDRLVGDIFDIDTVLPQLQASNNRPGVCHCYTTQIILYYLFNKNDEAAQLCDRALDYLDGNTATFGFVLYHWFSALVQLQRYAQVPPTEQQTILAQVQQQQDKLRHWATFAPTNHQHRWELVTAEKHRVDGKQIEAIEYYDRAISSAKINGFIQDEALANELAAKFYLSWGKEKFATIYMQEASDCYQRWGAKAKTDDLEAIYPQLLTCKIPTPQSPTTRQIAPNSNSSNSAVELDLSTLFKASQAISGEIEFPKLLAKLLNITLANAGADKVVLLLQAEQELQIAALLQAGQQPQILTPAMPMKLSQDVSIGVVNSVKRSCEPLILATAKECDRFAGDRYFQQHQHQSILCSPILHQGQLLGILYLENRLTSNVFTTDRLEVLTILCSQAAIALENARLFNAEQAKSQALSASLAQLQQSELRFKNLFEKSTDAIMLLGKDGFIDCNEAAVKLFGYSHKSQLCQIAPAQLAPTFQPGGQSSAEQSKSDIDRAIICGSHRCESVQQRANGELFWAEKVLTPIKLAGEQVIHAIVRDISDRKQAEIALSQSESKFRSLVEDTSDLIFKLDLEGVFTYISPQVEEILGYHPSELLGHSTAEFTHAEDLPLMLTNIQQLLETGTKQNGIEFRVPRKEGGWAWMVFNNSPIKDATGTIIGFQGIGRDVTAQKTAIQERQRQADALQAIVEGTAGKTGAAFYQACTKYLAEIFDVQYAFLTKLIDDSYTKTQMLALWTGSEFLEPYEMDLAGTPCLVTYQNDWGIFPSNLQSMFPDASALASLQGESYISVTIKDFNGQVIGNLGAIDTKPLPSDTSMMEFILQLFANRVAAEMKRQTDADRMYQTNQRLELTNQELLHATQLKDEFLATMSHELRTPLNAILGMSEILQEEVLGAINPRQLKSLQTIERSGQHLLSLINDILDVSKISAGKLELETQTVVIADLCKSSLEPIEQQACKKQIQLTVNLPVNAGAIVVDERRMRQVLINLLSNAIKFTDVGGFVNLTIRRQDRQADLPGWLEFAVTDTGIGIAPADCERLFQPFVQLDSRLSRNYEGTGLGLTLVKQIVELHSGSVALESIVGQGSCFTVRLPQTCLVVT